MPRRLLVLAVLAALLTATLGLTGRTTAQDDDGDDLEATVEALEAERDDLDATVEALEAEIEAQRAATVEALAEELEAQQTAVADLEERVAALETAAAETPTPTPEATDVVGTPVTVGDGEVLYEADATGGFDEWTGSADWLLRDGQLVVPAR